MVTWGAAALLLATVMTRGSRALTCPAGWASPKPGQKPCRMCSSGRFAAGGTVCSRCSPGTFSAKPGAIRCELCPLSKYREANYGASLCQACPSGRSTIGRGTAAQGQCRVLLCPPGKALIEGRCLVCPPGRFAARATHVVPPIWSAPCSLCPRGKFQPRKGESRCLACRAGRELVLSASASMVKPCAACAPGKFRRRGMTHCHSCSRGMYQPDAGRRDCFSCPTGQFEAQPGCSDAFKCCKQCVAGRYAPHTGSYECARCARGKYQPNAGAAACALCPKGRYNSKTGCGTFDRCCKPCGRGQWSASRGTMACSNCPLGKHQPFRGKEACFMCFSASAVTLLESNTTFNGSTSIAVKTYSASDPDTSATGTVGIQLHFGPPSITTFALTAWLRTRAGEGGVWLAAIGKDHVASQVALTAEVDRHMGVVVVRLGGDVVVRGRTSVSTGDWHHVSVAMHFAKGSAVVYVDKRLDKRGTFVAHDVGDSDAFIGGTRLANAGKPLFVGQMAHVTYWRGVASLSMMWADAVNNMLAHEVLTKRRARKRQRKRLNACRRAAAGNTIMLVACDRSARDDEHAATALSWYEQHKELLARWRKVHLGFRPRTTCKMGSHIACKAGTAPASTGVSFGTGCIQCRAGRFSPGDGVPCMHCPAGRMTRRAGSSNCELCAAGHTVTVLRTGCSRSCRRGEFMTIHWDRTRNCVLCPAGKYGKSVTGCASCANGRFSEPQKRLNRGAIACQACPAGRYSNASSPTCVDCPANTFALTDGMGKCRPCPKGRYQLHRGRDYCSELTTSKMLAASVVPPRSIAKAHGRRRRSRA